MRASLFTLSLAIALGLAGCARDDHRNEPPARELGREAHHAADDIKRGADKAAREAKQAGRQFREGWEEGKHDAPPPPAPPPPRDQRTRRK